jgi:hypothetical protein
LVVSFAGIKKSTFVSKGEHIRDTISPEVTTPPDFQTKSCRLRTRLCRNPKFWRSKTQIEIPEDLGQGEALYLIHLLFGSDVGERGVT